MPNERVTIRTPDGDCPMDVLVPPGHGPWPAVILYMDAGGIRPAMRDMARHLSEAGYVVALPDLFYRYGTAPSCRGRSSPATSAQPSAR
ncbi:dienelactone hydrolase family protein [Methylobacterium sp. Leaf94]|uniref:dienelactone hydrolase family protein n=1 Tax=Methylobacterium sp. Leaf94 TaxID=1736250 RepID=UPI000AB8603C|nr:dienelactone hydrolase family protein [Methylobacterium sp. Leaf94]